MVGLLGNIRLLTNLFLVFSCLFELVSEAVSYPSAISFILNPYFKTWNRAEGPRWGWSAKGNHKAIVNSLNKMQGRPSIPQQEITLNPSAPGRREDLGFNSCCKSLILESYSQPGFDWRRNMPCRCEVGWPGGESCWEREPHFFGYGERLHKAGVLSGVNTGSGKSIWEPFLHVDPTMVSSISAFTIENAWEHQP